MPELPEVENVRRSLQTAAKGLTVLGVRIHRLDIIEGVSTDSALLVGHTLTGFLRHGKQLALVGSAAKGNNGQRVICVHLGMTGSLRVCQSLDQMEPDHRHVQWSLSDGSTLVFRDPRRFGGIWTFPSLDHLKTERWSKMGPDALEATDKQLQDALSGSKRPIKAALLDQGVVAGLGNIYVDELLFRSAIHPATLASRLKPDEVERIMLHARAVLLESINAGGSSLRDYVDADGKTGEFQLKHKVYGRAGQSCVICSATLESLTLAGRTTVFCKTCQKKR